MNKLNYFIRCLLGTLQKRECPYCFGTDFRVVQRKYVVTQLLKCKKCGLQHRYPKDSEFFLKKFYQKDYHVNVEMMTDLPSDDVLKELKENNFDSLRDFVPILESLSPGKQIKIVDYGCSWGYNVYKLKKSGMDAVGYELSVPRAQFGVQKLGIDISTNEKEIRDDNDIMFSSHVIEHLSSINSFVELSKRKIKQDGIFIALCPNGSEQFKESRPETFKVTWGSLHPNYLDIEFASYMFRNNPFMLLTSDWPYSIDKIRSWDGRSQYIDDVRKEYELMIVAKPNILLK